MGKKKRKRVRQRGRRKFAERIYAVVYATTRYRPVNPFCPILDEAFEPWVSSFLTLALHCAPDSEAMIKKIKIPSPDTAFFTSKNTNSLTSLRPK